MADDRSHGASAFRIFAILWAWMQFIELLIWSFWPLTPWGWLVFFAASWTLLNPGSVLRFAVLIATSSARIFADMPFVPNHVLFTWMQTLVILAVLVVLFVKHRGRVSAADCIAGFGPLLRMQLVALYFVCGLQKFNHDYLDPAVSCAAEAYRQIAGDLKFLPDGDWTLLPAIYGSLVLEFGIPVLLLIPRTRVLGIWTAILFHSLLGFHAAAAVYGFSAVIFVQLSLFMPGPALHRLANARDWPSLKVLKLGNGKAAAWLFIIMYFAVFRTQVWFYFNVGKNIDVFMINHRLGWWFWLVTSVWIAIMIVVALGFGRKERTQVARARWLPATLATALIVGNTIMPWIGGKTQTSFSMFSNLRTEFNENHVFLRRVSLLHSQDDMVEILRSEPDIFSGSVNLLSPQQHSNTGRIMAMFELRRLAHQIKGPLEIEFVRHGKTVRAARDAEGRISGVAEVFDAPGFWARKLLWWRRHDTYEGPMHCTH